MKFTALALLAAIAPFVSAAPTEDVGLVERSGNTYEVKLFENSNKCGGSGVGTIAGTYHTCVEMDPSKNVKIEKLDEYCEIYFYQSLNQCVTDFYGDTQILRVTSEDAKTCQEPYTSVSAYRAFCGES